MFGLILKKMFGLARTNLNSAGSSYRECTVPAMTYKIVLLYYSEEIIIMVI